MSAARGYQPIRDYALVGDCHGAALVARDGSVDWCALERYDADPVFCRLLDAGHGGFLAVEDAAALGRPPSTSRRYVGASNVLETVLTTSTGQAALVDFMPVGRGEGARVHDYVDLEAPGWFVRFLEGRGGRARLRVVYRPSVAFAERTAALSFVPGEVRAAGGPVLVTDLPMSLAPDAPDAACCEVDLGPGERCALVVAPRPLRDAIGPARLARLLETTRAFWEEWAAYCRYDGPYREDVLRSALALKALTYAPTGALVAAPTTSLPEAVGGPRNWDYRYCWLRDASMTLYALAALGYSGEARRFGGFLFHAVECSAPRVQVLYGVGGECDVGERELPHLEGYAGSRPVRTGNDAYRQEQLDVYGEVLDWAWLHTSLGAGLAPRQARLLEQLAELVVARWAEPDHGLWEMRCEPRHHVYGKVMCWVALDRALRLLGPRRTWARERERIARAVAEQGVHRTGGHLLQAFGREEVDAASLLVPMVGFPLEEGVLSATVREVRCRLLRGGLLQRYEGADGLPGGEGAFTICSSWLVDALLRLGRVDEAGDCFERLLAHGNDLGLFSEEVEPASGAFLGNFPQAFTHLAIVLNAVHLQTTATRGVAALAGGHADRARRVVEATSGWRAVWTAFKQTGRVGRLRSSRASVLPAPGARP